MQKMPLFVLPDTTEWFLDPWGEMDRLLPSVRKQDSLRRKNGKLRE